MFQGTQSEKWSQMFYSLLILLVTRWIKRINGIINPCTQHLICKVSESNTLRSTFHNRRTASVAIFQILKRLDTDLGKLTWLRTWHQIVVKVGIKTFHFWISSPMSKSTIQAPQTQFNSDPSFHKISFK